jgi:hypothetical protein
VNVAKLTVHENYQDGKAFENDIALWSLAEPLVMNEYVAGKIYAKNNINKNQG